MRIPEWLIIFLSSAAAIGVGGVILWMMNGLIDTFDFLSRRKKFEEDLRQAIATSQPPWETVLDLARLRGLTAAQSSYVLRVLIREVLTGREPALKDHLSLIQGYLAAQRSKEPFEGIPDEIRIHLERLGERDHQAAPLLEPLTAQVRELLALKSREYRKQKLYTVGGFVIGVVGLLFAGYAYLYPLPPEPATQALGSQQAIPAR